MSLPVARIHVVAAAIVDEHSRVLISQRPPAVHQGGLWEFPGGKLEPGETVEHGLQRELQEELGITVRTARPLIRIAHDYNDLAVLLDVWQVTHFDGIPAGCEGQPVRWVRLDALQDYPFPAANNPVIKAVSLPELYLITPEPDPDSNDFLARLAQALARGVSLVQLRVKRLPESEYRVLLPKVMDLCRQAKARLLLNADPVLVRDSGADGVHLNSSLLRALTQRPLGNQYTVAASCHTLEDVVHAGKLGLDFVVLSPVQKTASHPQTRPLGFDGLQRVTEQAILPVYALGGMQPSDLDTAFRHGAQGIAAIRGLWN